MQKKYYVLTLVLLVFGMMMFAGCGQESSSGSGNVKITYAIWDKNQKPGMDAIAEEFHKENPEITVEVQVIPWGQYWTKLEASATSDTMPDVFWMHSQSFLRYANNDLLMDLTDKVKGDVDLNNFPKDLVELYSKGGKLYAVPKDYDTIGLWYNKTLFDQKGIPYPDESWDWNKLVEVAQKLNDPDKGVYGIVAPPDQQSFYYNFVFQNGGEILNKDKTKSGYAEEATQQAVQYAVDFSQKYKVSPTVQQLADMSREQYFESGKAAMGLFGSWMLGDFKENEYVAKNCDVTVLPKGKKQATIYNGLGNAVAAKTKHPEEALKFVKFLGGETANKIQAEKSAAIPAYKGTEQGWVDANSHFNVKVYPEMLKYAVIFPNSESREKWMQLEIDLMSKIWSGDVSVKDGCNELAKQIDAMLATKTK